MDSLIPLEGFWERIPDAQPYVRETTASRTNESCVAYTVNLHTGKACTVHGPESTRLMRQKERVMDF